MQRSFSSAGVFAILAGAAGIGFAPVLVRLSETGPTATAFWRLLVALPPLWIWLGVRKHRGTLGPQPSTPREYWWMVLGGLFFTADLALWHWSLRLTSVTNSTLLTNLAPILVTIGAFIWFQERITALFTFGLMLAIAGGSLLVSGHFDQRHLSGDLLSIFTAFFYAAYLLAVKVLRQSFDPVTTMAWSGLASCPSLLLVAVLSGDKLLPVTVQGWGVLVALGTLSHIGGQTLIAYALGRLPASFSAVSLLLQPVIAAVLAWPILGEPITMRQILGGTVVLAGIALAHAGRAETKVSPSSAT